MAYLNKYTKDFKNLCTPAFIYLFISVMVFIVIAIQNFGNTTKYCLGYFECELPNTFIVFVGGHVAALPLETMDKESCIAIGASL